MHVLVKLMAQTINQYSRQINFLAFRIFLFAETSTLFICTLITTPIINFLETYFLMKVTTINHQKTNNIISGLLTRSGQFCRLTFRLALHHIHTRCDIVVKWQTDYNNASEMTIEQNRVKARVLELV